jgi:hypothetical protein
MFLPRRDVAAMPATYPSLWPGWRRGHESERKLIMNIKGKLALALFTVLAIGAVAAQGAYAEEEFRGPKEGPDIVTGELDPSSPATILTIEEGAGLAVSCENVKFEGTVPVTPTPELTLTATWGNTSTPTGCTAAGAAATVHAQHCATVYTSKTNADGHALVHIECSGTSENEILVTVPSLGVTLHIGAQTPEKGGVHYTFVETTPGLEEVTLHTTIEGIKTSCTGIGCFFVGTTVKTKLEGTETFKSFVDKCTPVTGTAKTTPSLANCEGEQISLFKQ